MHKYIVKVRGNGLFNRGREPEIFESIMEANSPEDILKEIEDENHRTLDYWICPLEISEVVEVKKVWRAEDDS